MLIGHQHQGHFAACCLGPWQEQACGWPRAAWPAPWPTTGLCWRCAPWSTPWCPWQRASCRLYAPAASWCRQGVISLHGQPAPGLARQILLSKRPNAPAFGSDCFFFVFLFVFSPLLSKRPKRADRLATCSYVRDFFGLFEYSSCLICSGFSEKPPDGSSIGNYVGLISPICNYSMGSLCRF